MVVRSVVHVSLAAVCRASNEAGAHAVSDTRCSPNGEEGIGIGPHGCGWREVSVHRQRFLLLGVIPPQRRESRLYAIAPKF